MTATKDANDTYVENLIDLLRPHSAGLSRHLVVLHLEQLRKSTGLSIPDTFEATVQSAFNQHCIQSEVFRGRNAPDDGFFCSVHDENTATWAVDVHRADAWLRTRSPHYELAQAIARVKGVPTEKALTAVENSDEKQRKEWRSNLKVKAVLAQIRAEKAVKALERQEPMALEFNPPPSNQHDGS